MEGVLHKSSLFLLAFVIIFGAATSLIGIIFGIIFSRIGSFISLRVTLDCCNGEKWTIPLSYINDIRPGFHEIFIYMEKTSS